MKKLISLVVAMFMAVAAFSQAYSLRVENQTQCVLYYQVFGDEICKCGSTYTGAVFVINPGDFHTYMTSVPLMGTYPATPRSIVGARILNGPPNCQAGTGTVGEPACGLPLTYIYTALRQDCSPCARVTARWFPAPNCQGMARLVFTP